jgi:flagellar export protein FliJ
MSTLDSLIRLHRWQLDERRRHLAELDQLVVKLRGELQRLDVEEKVEQAVASESVEGAYAYGGYAKELIDRRHKLKQSLAEAEQKIVAAREALAEAYQEVKRYETAAANRLLQQHRKIERRQQSTMDEIAIETHRRRRTAER